MEVVETDDADEDQIDGNDVIEEPRHDEDQDAGDKCDQRRDVGRGDDHDLNLLVELFGWDECDADTGNARYLHIAGTWRPVQAGFATSGTAVAAPSPRVRGEGRVRGRLRVAQNCGNAPPPPLLSHTAPPPPRGGGGE